MSRLGEKITADVCRIVRREGYVIERPYVFCVEDEEINDNAKVLKFYVDESGPTTLKDLEDYVEQGCLAKVKFEGETETFILQVNLF